jgi:hypothetical protein
MFLLGLAAGVAVSALWNDVLELLDIYRSER